MFNIPGVIIRLYLARRAKHFDPGGVVMYSSKSPQDDAIKTTRPAKIGAFIVDLSPQEGQGEERKADGINVAAEPMIKAKGIVKNELFIITNRCVSLPLH